MKRSIVKISRLAEKQILKLPLYIQEAVRSWAKQVSIEGVEQVRRMSSYRDKALSGNRLGQRSVRLNRAYRLFYQQINEEINIILIIEVNKHEY